jgi:hypothetical protein
LKFLRQQMATSEFQSDTFRVYTRCGMGIHPLITLNLNKSTRTSDFKSNDPIPIFLQLPFLRKPYMRPGHNLQPLPRGHWGIVFLKNMISGPFNYAEQNSFLKILIGCVWGNIGGNRG